MQREIQELTLKEIAKENQKEVCFLDTRSKIAYEHGHIPDAVYFGEATPEAMKQLPKDKQFIVYCSIGENSRQTVEKLLEAGYEAYNLAGGYRSWLLEHYEELSHSEIERYERQIILPEVGIEGQKKLKNARVLIVGAGGLGCPAALYLAAAGVGKIGIVDADAVSVSNLQRQILHDSVNVGMNKAESAKAGMERINDSVEVETYPYFITPDNIQDIIADYDFIIDAVDNFETKFLINDACVLAQKPFCHAGILRFEGQIMTYVPGENPCYRCVFEEIPERGSIPNCSQAGILGAVAGVVGCIQALEALKYILSIGELLVGKMLVINGLTMQFRMVRFGEKSKVCRVCGPNNNIRDVAENAAEYEQVKCSF
jgi:molybdopterin/thiamine biosynthesis adenylyltransferase/rhodanese-related sulfurtransferase